MYSWEEIRAFARTSTTKVANALPHGPTQHGIRRPPECTARSTQYTGSHIFEDRNALSTFNLEDFAVVKRRQGPKAATVTRRVQAHPHFKFFRIFTHRRGRRDESRREKRRYQRPTTRGGTASHATQRFTARIDSQMWLHGGNKARRQ